MLREPWSWCRIWIVSAALLSGCARAEESTGPSGILVSADASRAGKSDGGQGVESQDPTGPVRLDGPEPGREQGADPGRAPAPPGGDEEGPLGHDPEAEPDPGADPEPPPAPDPDDDPDDDPAPDPEPDPEPPPPPDPEDDPNDDPEPDPDPQPDPEPDPVPVGSAMGDRCDTDAACNSGLCLALRVGDARFDICSDTCCMQDDCPEGFGCVALGAGRFCVPPEAYGDDAPLNRHAGLVCDDGQYCHYEPGQLCGAADQLGECRDAPDVCTREFNPVCGCDGITYGNACNANAAGVSVGAVGECEGQQERGCGGIAGLICRGDAEYCHYEVDASCGAGDQMGVCMTKPEICTREFRPTCGCDGATYGNPCLANANGASVKSDGACEDDGPQVCGGFAGTPCEGAQYCHYEAEARCGIADATGVCLDRPEVCTREFAPVCGCDGATHGNACTANANGTSVAARGACDEDPPDGCGGIAGLTCEGPEDTIYCHYEPEQSCGAGDQMGACRTRPEICTRQFDPVCGCDGLTHGNACDANARGVSVRSRGACED